MGDLNLEPKIAARNVVLSLLGFIAFWVVVTDAWGYSSYLFSSDNGVYYYGYISRLVWVLPAVLLIGKNEYLTLSKKELLSRPRFDSQFVVVLSAILLYSLVSMFITHKGFWINRDVPFLLTVIKYFIVGCVEEAVFRGWGYNALTKVLSNRKSVAISTLMFVLLHWPAYFIGLFRFGTFDYAELLAQSFSALLWGILTCWLMRRSRTLWNPILAHFAYDLSCIMLIGAN